MSEKSAPATSISFPHERKAELLAAWDKLGERVNNAAGKPGALPRSTMVRYLVETAEIADARRLSDLAGAAARQSKIYIVFTVNPQDL